MQDKPACRLRIGWRAQPITFPAISTGIFGYPKDQAADVALKTLRSTPTRVPRIIMVAFDTATFNIYEDRLSADF
jgi:O-acetyl-ADP-ribose deacetylase